MYSIFVFLWIRLYNNVIFSHCFLLLFFLTTFAKLFVETYLSIFRLMTTFVPSDAERTCWVCFATDSDDPSLHWVKPCRCRGTTKWVHQHCLQRWVDEKQKGNSSAKVTCAVCGTDYVIIYPSPGE